MFTLVRDNDCNGARVEIAQERLSESNAQFIELMHKLGINRVNLTSIGNSIGTGFSFNDSLVPLLKRNTDLIDRVDFDLSLRAYARAEDNCDSNIFEWIEGNITQSEINEMVRFDYQSEFAMFQGLHKLLDSPNESDVSYAKEKISTIDSIVDKYYPEEVEDDIGLSDLIKQNEDGLANIFVYNGYTGGFLDKVTRKGLPHIFKGFRKDIDGLKANLRKIFADNPHAQVYVCGMPNITGLHFTYLVNRNLKAVCKEFPNCVYVAPAPQHLIYKKDGRILGDVHYNDEEYLKLNQRIMRAIVNNYIPTKILIDFHLFMRRLSDRFLYQSSGHSREEMDASFRAQVDQYFNELVSRYDLSPKQLKRLRAYYKEEYPHKFYYSPREHVLARLDEEIKNTKTA